MSNNNQVPEFFANMQPIPEYLVGPPPHLPDIPVPIGTFLPADLNPDLDPDQDPELAIQPPYKGPPVFGVGEQAGLMEEEDFEESSSEGRPGQFEDDVEEDRLEGNEGAGVLENDNLNSEGSEGEGKADPADLPAPEQAPFFPSPAAIVPAQPAAPNAPVLPVAPAPPAPIQYQAGAMVNGVYVPPPGGYNCHRQDWRGTNAKNHDIKGNPPAGITDLLWDKTYNRTDSRIGTRYGTNQRKARRESGETRAWAVQILQDEGILPAKFVDNNP